MGKLIIDKLDLSKKKSVPEPAAQQQVPVRLTGHRSAPEESSENTPVNKVDNSAWERSPEEDLVRQVAIHSPKKSALDHEESAAGGKNITKKTVRRLAPESARAGESSLDDNSVWERKPEEDLERQVAIHSEETSAELPKKSLRIRKGKTRAVRRSTARTEEELLPDVPARSFTDRIKPIIDDRKDSIDLKSYQKKSELATLVEHTAKSFFNKISEKTMIRKEAEAASVNVQTEESQPIRPSGASYDRHLLSSGLRMITAPIAGTKTITALIMFGTGSKYESLSVSGISHFLEHMFFKGTKNRPNTQKISSELDALGSEYNAFTSKEYTGYWIKVDSSKIAPALDILSDMLLNSKFSAAEIEKEKGVIIEEINMCHENPMMYIEDVFEACLYGDTPAGREITGPKANISAFKRQVFTDYFNAQYGANSAVLCLAGDINERTEKLAEKYFKEMPKTAFREKLRTADAQQEAQVRIHYKEGNQAIISLGVRAYDAYHKDKMILKVLSAILGGSMSSRMFEEVREKRGLAYFVRTSAECYTDTGYLTTQAGVPVGKQGEAIKVILQEYKKICKTLVSKEELTRAKDLIKGRTIIGFEASDNVADWYARQAVLREEILSPEQYFSKLDKVTAEDIRRVAKDIFKNEKLNLAIIGPFKGGEDFVKAVSFGK